MSMRLCFITFVLTLSFTTAAAVQSGGAIEGIVRDTAGAVIPGVQITAKHLSGSGSWETVTNERGVFILYGIPPGDVQITAILPGFRNWTSVVRAGTASVRVSVVLEVASVAETVSVVAGAPAVNYSYSVGSLPVMNTEAYDHISENGFVAVADEARSTFAIDVDTASYSNVRRFINEGTAPPPDAVRVEELINYFSYDYPKPDGTHPVAIHTEAGVPFWEPRHRLVKIGLRAVDIDLASRKPVNLVLLIDVSGSMDADAKLPLVKRALHLLVDQLHETDRVGIVVYAGASGLKLPPTPGSQKKRIHSAIESLEAGGSTNGGSGIQLAYQLAAMHFIPSGFNRVILATDGDFNVGVTNEGELVRLIEKQAETGVFLTVLGFGMGNYKDSTLEKLADKGHGNYAYIDNFNEARRVLLEQMSGTLLTVAKDVKLQIEFNPAEVHAYRLIGYENRLLDDADFDNDAKQGGDIGAGHNVTALFEIVPKDALAQTTVPLSMPLKYQTQPALRKAPKGELLTVSLRYKHPDGARSSLLSVPVVVKGDQQPATADFQFASAVAAFGMLLRDSEYTGSATFEAVIELAKATQGNDPGGYRAEFVKLAVKARALSATSRQ